MEKRIKQLGKIFFLSTGVMASASMLTGCAEEVAALTGGSGDGAKVEVTASFLPLENAAFTRAADGLDDGTSGFSLLTSENSSSKVRVMVDQNDGTYSPFDYSITGTTAIGAPNPAPTFNSGVNSVNVYGWYPATDLSSFTVKTDQSGKVNYCLSDLMWANSDTSTRDGSNVNKSATLSFAHVMSKVKVNLTLASGVTVKNVKLKNVKPTITVAEQKSGNTVTGYTTSSLAGSAGDITLLSGGSLTSSSAEADKKLCGVFPPQDINGALLEITANYNGGEDQTITYSVESAKTFATNKEYVMNISLNGTSVTTGTVTLTGWNAESGVVNVNTGGGGGDAPTLSPTSLTMTFGHAASSITASGVGSAWTALSADPNVATVSGTGPISVTPAGVGSTTVYVWPTAGVSGGFSTASCAVTVSALELQQDNSSNYGYVTFGAIPTQIWTGSALEPKPTVQAKINGTNITLVEGTDFDFSYANNVDQGILTATLTVTGKGMFSGSVSQNFSIGSSVELSAVTESNVGKPVGANGRVYCDLSQLTAAGTTCVGVLAYSGSTGHGLIISLEDATNQNWNTINGWSDQTTQGFTGKKLPDAAARRNLASYTTLGSTTVSDWMVLSKDDYTTMWNAFGGATTGTYNSTSNGYITAAGGTECSGYYWSATECDDTRAWYFSSGSVNRTNKSSSPGVRPVLAF